MDATQIGLALTAACLAAATTVVKARSEPITPPSINTEIVSRAPLPESQTATAVRVKIRMASQEVTVEFRD